MATEVEADLEATTYADVAAADAAAEFQPAAVKAAWNALDDDEKLAGLTARTMDIDTLDWIGDRASDDQALEWPRTDTDYSVDAWPTRLVNAVIQQTFADALSGTIGTGATANPVNPETTANIKREKVGPIETEWFGPTATATNIGAFERFAPIVQNLLRPLIAIADESAWGIGVAVRSS